VHNFKIFLRKIYIIKYILERISQVFNVQEWQIIAVNDLFEKQATIPFLSRYRKEATGNLDETIV
jgi:uncharacterized protein